MNDDGMLIRRALRFLAERIDDAVKAQLKHGGRLDDPSIQRDVRDRDRAIELARPDSVLAERGEPEWEYRTLDRGVDPAPHQKLTRGQMTVAEWFALPPRGDGSIVTLERRRKAGPWFSVKENTEALTDGSER